MIVTLKYLRERFKDFNELCFDGRLQEPRLRIGSARRMLGNVRYKKEKTLFGGTRYTDVTLSISNVYDLTEQELDDTILHEMIHLYIICNRKKDDSAHGPLFRQIMTDINHRFGRHITVSHKGKLQQSTRKSSQNIIVVTVLKSGTYCITRPSKTRIFYIHQALSHLQEVKKVMWYNTSNPYFTTLPRSIKLKLYRAEKETLERELNGAIPLRVVSSRLERA